MDRDVTEIEVAWAMPMEYAGRWTLFGPGGSMEIEAFPPKKLKVTMIGDFKGGQQSRALDWCQEVIERIRKESNDG